MNEAIDEIKRLAEEFADARYEEAKDQDHGNGKADTEYCRAEVARTRAAMIEAIDRLAALYADQARDARIQALEEAAKLCENMRDLKEATRAQKAADEAIACNDQSEMLHRLRHCNSVSLFNGALERAARDIRALAQATQPVPGGKELP